MYDVKKWNETEKQIQNLLDLSKKLDIPIEKGQDKPNSLVDLLDDKMALMENLTHYIFGEVENDHRYMYHLLDVVTS